ncbi:unnamed protein product [Arctia plantaginis]|uniref:Kazal-like domain-containing protein n=1 Tax=Arctia plantaginis TaxID=874455 RepID=A0A8S0ZJB1_ARCPL|nr:unnamed protein product [Arctia plantaginis]CAB3238345.1 unnamed protein product [Arctia plantaginis]
MTSVHWTQEHLTFPVNYCDLAKACVHDNRMVCATTENNCIRRTFLDQCDMYEYNCDYHADFRKLTVQRSPCNGVPDYQC